MLLLIRLIFVIFFVAAKSQDSSALFKKYKPEPFVYHFEEEDLLADAYSLVPKLNLPAASGATNDSSEKTNVSGLSQDDIQLPEEEEEEESPKSKRSRKKVSIYSNEATDKFASYLQHNVIGLQKTIVDAYEGEWQVSLLVTSVFLQKGEHNHFCHKFIVEMLPTNPAFTACTAKRLTIRLFPPLAVVPLSAQVTRASLTFSSVRPPVTADGFNFAQYVKYQSLRYVPTRHFDKHHNFKTIYAKIILNETIGIKEIRVRLEFFGQPKFQAFHENLMSGLVQFFSPLGLLLKTLYIPVRVSTIITIDGSKLKLRGRPKQYLIDKKFLYTHDQVKTWLSSSFSDPFDNTDDKKKIFLFGGSNDLTSEFMKSSTLLPINASFPEEYDMTDLTPDAKFDESIAEQIVSEQPAPSFKELAMPGRVKTMALINTVAGLRPKKNL